MTPRLVRSDMFVFGKAPTEHQVEAPNTNMSDLTDHGVVLLCLGYRSVRCASCVVPQAHST